MKASVFNNLTDRDLFLSLFVQNKTNIHWEGLLKGSVLEVSMAGCCNHIKIGIVDETSPAATSQKALPPLLLCSFVIFVQFQIIHWFKEQELQLISLLQLIPPGIKSQNFAMNCTAQGATIQGKSCSN